MIIAAIIAWISGGNPLGVIMQNAGQLTSGYSSTADGTYTPTAEEEQLATFSRQILAGTEDVWTKLFASQGLEYEAPTLVFYTGSVQSGCGNATAQVGPFYCSADQSLYIDLSFFSDMKQTLGADGDFAYAYVIAHEVGHHVQYLLGTLTDAHERMSKLNEADANKISVALELQAGQYEHGAVGCEHDFEYTVFGTLSTVHDDPPPISPDFSHDGPAMKNMYCP